MTPLDWEQIEEKWQRAWEKARVFEADPEPRKPKYFVTVAYPYPNSPQHIGHGRTYTLADAHARYMRMRGYNVLFPMAFHYTGTPVLAMSQRLAEGDQELIDTFLQIYKVPKAKLKDLAAPLKMASYFHEEIKSGMKKIGYSIDWRREFTTIDPQYSKFIEWQFQKLREAGFISRGSHPVGWCPNDGNPVGQHDTQGDVEPEIEEFTLIEFEYGDFVLPAATFRPETVFGVTNIWLNPKAEYVKAKVDGAQWIVSEEAVDKLRFLNRKVEVTATFSGETLVGQEAVNPLTGEKIPIFAGEFVDPKNATGVVMSVPGHAPYDYAALENLKSTPASQLAKYGLKPEDVDDLKPISIIKVPSYSACPAVDVVKKMGITDQTDPRLEGATKEVYRHEFHGGVMKENTGKYAGLPVAEAKERVKEDLVREGKAGTMYEIVNRPVICRCGTECVVKIFEDQWFIDYGNPKWKALAQKCFDQMEILPEELRAEFNYVIGWLREKACARKSGLGTKLPWDHEWIIESLSDSVIYMAYYTISKLIKEHRIQPSQLTEALFDYVFLGAGNLKKVAENTGLDAQVLKQFHEEFSYFYPLDSRHSGRDLVPNHLTFMVFNHTAIFPENLWPRQIAVNGSVLMEGQKMSKSFVNIIPLREAIKMFGADPLRIAVLAAAELLQDADFSTSLARSMGDRLERLYRFAVEIKQTKKESKDAPLALIDRWMFSRLEDHKRTATEAMDKLMVRKAIHSALYLLDQDFQWYLRRISGEKDLPARKGAVAKVYREVLDAQVRMLAPATPHICEEIWAKLGKTGFVSVAEWPTCDEKKVDVQAEETESVIKGAVEDTSSILRAIKVAPKRICYYAAADWKWRVFLKAVKGSASAKIVFSDFMKELMADSELKAIAGKVSKFAREVLDEVNRMPTDQKQRILQVGIMDEKKILNASEGFFEKEFNAKVEVYGEDDVRRHDPKNRAQLAKPRRPAIFIE